MSLWETIIGIAERSWGEKLRKDAVQDFAELRMIDASAMAKAIADIEPKSDTAKIEKAGGSTTADGPIPPPRFAKKDET
jgi:hypothetical protein